MPSLSYVSVLKCIYSIFSSIVLSNSVQFRKNIAHFVYIDLYGREFQLYDYLTGGHAVDEVRMTSFHCFIKASLSLFWMV